MSKRNKARAAVLTLTGTGLLLLSFITQNFIYETWDAQRTALVSAMSDRALVDKGALLNELLYFSVQSQPSDRLGVSATELARGKLKLAARKLADSAFISFAGLDSLSREEKSHLREDLELRLTGVQTYADFLNFVSALNTSYGEYAERLASESHDMQERRSVAKTIYLCFNLLGSIMLLSGLWFDRRDTLAT